MTKKARDIASRTLVQRTCTCSIVAIVANDNETQSCWDAEEKYLQVVCACERG